MKRLLVVVAVLLLFCGSAAAETTGLIPTLTKDTSLTGTRSVDVPKRTPIVVVGLEGFAWFGPSANAGGAVVLKHQIGHIDYIDATFYAGVLTGFSAVGEGTDLVVGGFLQLQIAKIPSIAVLVRRDGGSWLINPGFQINAISWE